MQLGLYSGSKATALAALLLGATLFWAPESAHAADPDPPFTIQEAHAFQCLIECGSTDADKDMLVVIRYEMPPDDWRNTTYMQEITCVDDDENNPIDLCQTSLFSGIMAHTFYDGPQLSATKLRERTPPRINNGMTAFYFTKGHGLSFGSLDSTAVTYETCMEPSSTVFTPALVKCSIPIYHDLSDINGDGFTDILDARTINAAATQTIGKNLEAAYSGLTGLLMQNDLIAPPGMIYFSEAYTNWVKAAPGAFTISKDVNSDVVLNSGETGAEIAIAAEASASKLFGYVDDFRMNHLPGTSMNIVGGILIGAIGVIVLIVILAWLKNAFIAIVVGALFIFGGGVLNNFVDLKVYYVTLIIPMAVGLVGYFRSRGL